LQVLINDDGSTNENGDATSHQKIEEGSDGGALLTPQPTSTQGAAGQDYTFGRNANYTPRNGELRQRDISSYQQNLSQTNEDFTFMPDGPDGFYDEESGNNGSQTKFQRQQFDKFAKRTVLLANLPEGATHSDVVDAVRGGMLLDIYLRTHDRTASVSFLEEAAAHEFFRHVKRHDLYIRGKRVGDPTQPAANSPIADAARLKFVGMIANSFFPGTWPTRSQLGQRETLLFRTAAQDTPKKQFEMI
jgi:hypothetical protein